MVLYAPKSEAITAVQLQNTRISNKSTTLFCPEIGFFDPEVSEGFYGLPVPEGMLWGNPGDWLIRSEGNDLMLINFRFMSDEDFREKYYRLAYSDPPGEV